MKLTPDLRNHFAPQPKPNAKAKSSPKPLNPIGKKGKLNKDANEKMKEEFEKIGITTCEARLPGCWKNNALSFAHKDKRRYLSPTDLLEACLFCIPCHSIVEKWPREKMKKFIENIIKKRSPYKQDKNQI